MASLDTLALFEDALKWLDEIGMTPNPSSRFPHARAHMLALKEVVERRALAPDSAKFRALLHAYFGVLPDVFDLIRIKNRLARLLVDPRFKQTIGRMLGGPVFERDEKPRDLSAARDAQHELAMAARFAAAGFMVDLAVEDFRARRANLVFHVECKRLSHEGALDSRLRKAVDQLRRHNPGSKAITVACLKLWPDTEGDSSPMDDSCVEAAAVERMVEMAFGNVESLRARAEDKVAGLLLCYPRRSWQAAPSPDEPWRAGVYTQLVMTPTSDRFREPKVIMQLKRLRDFESTGSNVAR